MRIFLALLSCLALILAALCEFILPATVSNILKERIVNATAASNVDVSLRSNPNARIALGSIASLHATAEDARISDVDFKSLTLDAENATVDVPALLFSDTLSYHADSITLCGVITQEALKDYVLKKVSTHVENAAVTITPEEVVASGEIKFMGRRAAVEIAGGFVVEEGICFRVSRLSVSGAIVRNVQLERYLGDIEVLSSKALPAGLHFLRVELGDGFAVFWAGN